ASKINPDVVGDGLTQNATGALEVDTSQLTDGAGNITSTNNEIIVTYGDNATFHDVILAIANGVVTEEKLADDAVTTQKLDDEAVTASKINTDVAGAGLTKNPTTGALDVDSTTAVINWANITGIPADIDLD